MHITDDQTHIADEHMHDAEEHAHGADGHTHKHGHSHTHSQTKSVLNRLARASGHLEYVRRMVENGEDCIDVLMQLAAVRSALNNTAKIILKDHIEHCIVSAVSNNDNAAIEDLNKAIDRYIN